MSAPIIVAIDYVDYGVQGEYGPFGKVVARSRTDCMSAAQIATEKAEMIEKLGSHIVAVDIEFVPAVGNAIDRSFARHGITR